MVDEQLTPVSPPEGVPESRLDVTKSSDSIQSERGIGDFVREQGASFDSAKTFIEQPRFNDLRFAVGLTAILTCFALLYLFLR